MFLKKAEGLWFRNYEKFSLEFTKPLNVFIGDNGQGKSSFLEAVYCALKGKSFFPFITTQIIQEGKSFSQVLLRIKEDEGESDIAAKFTLKEKSLKKEFFYCGKKSSARFISKKFPCLVFTEESMSCIRRGREQRLAFIDEMLPEAEGRPIKDRYAKALKQKKAILKNLAKGRLSRAGAKSLLKALRPVFLESGARLVEERLRALRKIFKSLEAFKEGFFESRCELDFSYSLSGAEGFEGPEAFARLEEDLKKYEDRELEAGIALSGPHKHELRFLFNKRDSRLFCSKGQQRALLFSLLAGHIQSSPRGFLFLDDALLELDEGAQERFLKFLEKNHCQTFLTNCKMTAFKTENMSVFYVKKGAAAEQ